MARMFVRGNGRDGDGIQEIRDKSKQALILRFADYAYLNSFRIGGQLIHLVALSDYHRVAIARRLRKSYCNRCEMFGERTNRFCPNCGRKNDFSETHDLPSES